MVEKPAATHSAVSVVVPLRTNKKNHVGGLLPLTLSWCCRWPAACRALLMHLRKPPCRSSWSNRPHNWNVCRKTEHVLLRHAVPAPPKPKHDAHRRSDYRRRRFGDAGLITGSLSEVFPAFRPTRAFPAPSWSPRTHRQRSVRRQSAAVGVDRRSTNSAITPDQLDQIRNMIGPDRVLVLVNAHGDHYVDSTYQPGACRLCGPHIRQWCWWIGMPANANAQVLGSDGIHPSMDSDIYARRSDRPSNNGSQAAGERQATLSCPTGREERLC